MSKWLLILLGLFGVGAMTYLCATRHRPDIEADLTQRTGQTLAGIEGVSAAAEGQVITLRGEVPDQAARDRAGNLAAGVWGVSEVRNLLEIKAIPVLTQEKREAINCQETFNTLLSEPIRYATGSSVIARSSRPLLNKLADAAKACPSADIEIGGHTDARGKLAMNMKLSQARANSVMAYLQKRGIGKKQLSAVGYGPTKPIADNATPEGMEKNRRTEFKVKGL